MDIEEKIERLAYEVTRLHKETAHIEAMERAWHNGVKEAAQALGIENKLAMLIVASYFEPRMRIRRLLDQPAGHKPDQENLSFRNLLKDLKKEQATDLGEHTLQELTACVEELEVTAKPVLDAVNKILAHNDINTIRSPVELGAMPDGYAPVVHKMYEWLRKAGCSGIYGSNWRPPGVLASTERVRNEYWEKYRGEAQRETNTLAEVIIAAADGAKGRKASEQQG